MTDDFQGDTPHLIRCIESLLALDAKGALVPHGVGGHARALLSASAVRLAALSAGQAQPVAIKPLEWEYVERRTMTYTAFWADGDVAYYINQSFGSDSYYFRTIRWPEETIYDGDDLPSAKAAAQSDYEARIRSALSVPLPEIEGGDKGDGWQPADTAPQAGFFLAWSPDHPELAMTWKAEIFHQARTPGTPRHLSANHFTLWMPIPLPGGANV